MKKVAFILVSLLISATVVSAKPQISAGVQHASIIRADGTLWAWGGGSNHATGLNSINNTSSPTKVSNDTDWKKITGSVHYHTILLKNNGTMWGYGDNTSGQMGNGSSGSDLPKPTQIPSPQTDIWIDVDVGFRHTLAISGNGTLWAWGRNFEGQIGVGSTSALENNPRKVLGDKVWRYVAAGAYSSYAIRDDGTLWSWGRNNAGELGNGTTTNTATPVQVGTANDWVKVFGDTNHHNAFAIKSNGSLWGWGQNQNGSLGDGTSTQRLSPVLISNDHWLTVTTKDRHSFGIKIDGTLWGWGMNTQGILGDGTNVNWPTPIQIGSSNTWVEVQTGLGFTIARQANGTIHTWGLDGVGQQGLGDTNVQHLTPTKILDPIPAWVDFDSYATNSMGLLSNGSLWVWGNGADGQLGNGATINSSTPVNVAPGTLFRSVSMGSRSIYAIRNDGTLWAWGQNQYGRLGIGGPITPNIHSTPQHAGAGNLFTQVKAGNEHVLAIGTGGKLWAAGRNASGQLGDNGGATNATQFIRIGSDTDWTSVAAGLQHSKAIKSNGKLYSRGAGSRVGNGGTADQDAPLHIASGNKFRTTSGSYSAILSLSSQGNLWANGLGSEGQMGSGNSFELVPEQIADGQTWRYVNAAYNCMALDLHGNLWGWGRNSNQQLGFNQDILNKHTPVLLQSGGNWLSVRGEVIHGMGLKTDGTLWVWGQNSVGVFGDGLENNLSPLPKRVFPKLVNVTTNLASETISPGTTSGNIVARLNFDPIFDVTVGLTLSGNEDFTITGNSTLYYSSGNHTVPQKIEITLGTNNTKTALNANLIFTSITGGTHTVALSNGGNSTVSGNNTTSGNGSNTALTFTSSIKTLHSGFNYLFQGSGGNSPYAYDISEHSPGAVLSIDSGTGFLTSGGSGNFIVRVTDSSGNTAFTKRIQLRSGTDKLESLSFGPSNVLKDYKTLATSAFIPDGIKAIEKSIGPSSDTTWRLFQYDPSTSSYLEYPNTKEKFAPGQGYWFFSFEPRTITLTGKAGPIQGAYPVRLKPGWNQIANPFTSPITWNTLYATDGKGKTHTNQIPGTQVLIKPNAFVYNNLIGEYEIANTLLPFNSYWVKNITNSDVYLVMSTIFVPATTNPVSVPFSNKSSDLPPPPPGFNASSSTAAASGGGGGCFLSR